MQTTVLLLKSSGRQQGIFSFNTLLFLSAFFFFLPSSQCCWRLAKPFNCDLTPSVEALPALISNTCDWSLLSPVDIPHIAGVFMEQADSLRSKLISAQVSCLAWFSHQASQVLSVALYFVLLPTPVKASGPFLDLWPLPTSLPLTLAQLG